MCKLCNTTEPPKIHKSNSPHLKLFIATTRDYTGEYPCSKCLDAFRGRVSNRTPEEGMDKYVLTKLYKRYRPFTAQNKVHECTSSRYKYKSYLGIETYTNVITHKATFRVRINGRGRSTSFETFEEALNYKLQLLSTGAHPKSLTILTNQLKELQNDNNKPKTSTRTSS